jgi:hypothetical protein
MKSQFLPLRSLSVHISTVDKFFISHLKNLWVFIGDLKISTFLLFGLNFAFLLIILVLN